MKKKHNAKPGDLLYFDSTSNLLSKPKFLISKMGKAYGWHVDYFE